jgi:hypothetical protein
MKTQGKHITRKQTHCFSGFLCVLLCCLSLNAQEAMSQSSAAVGVPRLVNFSDKVTDAQGRPTAGVVGVTFAIYKQQYEGPPLWLETQNAQADSKGIYQVQLGATKAEGLPLELFGSGEARWLGVRVNGGEEQPRVLLLSVPYALKAADAQTLGGLPASAFMLAGQRVGTPPAVTSGGRSLTPQILPASAVTGSGTAHFMPLWTGKTTLGNSEFFETGSGASTKVGINTTTPATMLDVNGAATVRGFLTATGVVSGSSFSIGGKSFAFGSSSLANAFLGFAGNSTMTGDGNTGIGSGALAANTTGLSNTATGTAALQSNNTGGGNTGSGDAALFDNTTGSENTAMGWLALDDNNVGSKNTAMGVDALLENTGGGFNTAIGFEAGYLNIGSENTFVGSGANTVTNQLSLTNASAVGFNAMVGQSNTLILGAPSTTIGIGTPTPFNDYGLDVDTTLGDQRINGGVVVNASGGNLYLGMTEGVHKFRVDTNGVSYADGGFQSSGADFAESLAVRGPRSAYEPGDVLEIDQKADRHVAVSRHAYATLVAGIYSTKPGVLATPHHIDDFSFQSKEVPLAVVGIVPCKVTAENGAIARGDLLVTSSRAGYAMKGTDRRRMLGAIVGKALQPLSAGQGVIEVLVTLQ